ncbi:MAG: choice-of-anchor B family protein [Planctomycetota bacterium]
MHHPPAPPRRPPRWPTTLVPQSPHPPRSAISPHTALWITGVALLATTASALHDDDPKALDRTAPYQGPGWRPGALGTSSLGPPQFGGSFDSQGVQCLAWVSLGDLGVSGGGTDCWGYVSPSGREYAILGTEESTEFLEVTVPTNPVSVGSIPGPVGIWRDVKVYGEYCYSVCETNGLGIQVIDLTQIDAGIVQEVKWVEGTDTGASHNVVINEESGYLYRTGGGGHGLRIYDLANPADPLWVATWDERYVHDAQVVTWADGREIAFCAGGFNGGWSGTGLSILDVSDKQNIKFITELFHPNPGYDHQGWLSEDRQYFYMGDELDEDGVIFTTTHVFDVSDVDQASYLTEFTNQSHAVGHNMYTLDGKLYQANYLSGLRVFDLDQSATAPPEVAYFDPHPGADTADFGGSWGNFPYLPSGVVLLSDRQLGLFILWVGDDIVGTSYCAPSEANSSGTGARIVAQGSDVAVQNDLTLVAYNLPVSKSGYFLVSATQAFIPLPPGSQGTLCLGGQIGRYAKQVQSSGPGGSFSLAIDLGALPVKPPHAVQPGETWNFQAWFRDTHPGQTSNFTDGVSILFQ